MTQKNRDNKKISNFWGESFFQEPQIQFLPQFDATQHAFPNTGYKKEDFDICCVKAWGGVQLG